MCVCVNVVCVVGRRKSNSPEHPSAADCDDADHQFIKSFVLIYILPQQALDTADRRP